MRFVKIFRAIFTLTLIEDGRPFIGAFFAIQNIELDLIEISLISSKEKQ
jgi:hypothetical protein